MTASMESPRIVALRVPLQTKYLPLAGALALLVILYWPGLGGGFDFDDYPNIVNNDALRVAFGDSWSAWMGAVWSSHAGELQRPLAMLSFAINHAFAGLDPFWMKLTNLTLHAFNMLLAWFVVDRVVQVGSPHKVRRAHAAIWIAGFWGAAGINATAVLFVVQRMEVLCQLFVLMGLGLYITGRLRLVNDARGGWLLMLAGVLGCTALATLAKESGVLLPVYTLVLEITVFQTVSAGTGGVRRLRAFYVGVLILPMLLGVWWLGDGLASGLAYAGRDFTMTERLLTESRVLLDYLHWTVLPNPGTLSLYHDDYVVSRAWLTPPGTLGATLALAALATAGIAMRKRRPVLALGIAWFLTAHLLTGTLLPLELAHEHRNYFASLGVAFALADLLLLTPTQASARRIGILLAILLLAWQAAVTGARAREWSNPIRHAQSEAAKRPNSPRATYALARAMIIAGRNQPDSPYTRMAWQALADAMRVSNGSPLPESAALMLAAQTGVPIHDAWWLSLQTKLRARPIGRPETAALADLVQCQIEGHCTFPRQAMVDSFLAALRDPPNPEVLSIYGNYALNVLTDPELALRLWQEAGRLAPKVAPYQVTLARMLIASGRSREAAIHIDQLRHIGRWGQNEEQARRLESMLVQPDGSRSREAGTSHPAPERK